MSPLCYAVLRSARLAFWRAASPALISVGALSPTAACFVNDGVVGFRCACSSGRVREECTLASKRGPDNIGLDSVVHGCVRAARRALGLLGICTVLILTFERRGGGKQSSMLHVKWL